MFSDQWNKGRNPDVQDKHIEEHWGIMDKFRKPKSGYYGLQEAYAKIKERDPLTADIEPYIREEFPFPPAVNGHKLIEDFETSQDYLRPENIARYTGSASMKTAVSAEKAWSGSKSLRLEYQAKAITDWGCAVLKFPVPLQAGAKGLGFWLYRDGSLNTFIVKVEDQDRDPWEGYSVNLGTPGWTYYCLDFNRVVRSVYGSPGSENSNRVFDQGTVDTIIFLFTTAASPDRSVVFVDDVEVLY